jgi:hypothetical protein
MMMEGIGWFTLSFINVAIAQTKNRKGVLWFFVSLLFGPLATVMLITIFKDPVKAGTIGVID